MFSPDEIIFSLTSECNLHCAHCTVKRNGEALFLTAALDFLRDIKNYYDAGLFERAKENGGFRVGFSGGEPFLEIESLSALSRLAVDLDFVFDAISTNGVWWGSTESLDNTLRLLFDSGFDGTIRISVDNFHKTSYEKAHGAGYERAILSFIEHVRNIFSSTINIEVQSVVDGREKDEKDFLDFIPSGVPLIKTLESYPSGDPRSFGAGFKDSDCLDMGNIFFIHSNGFIAPCCGFNNECPALVFGRVTDGVPSLVKSINNNKTLDLIFNKGLSSLMGACDYCDPCAFCEKVFRRQVGGG